MKNVILRIVCNGTDLPAISATLPDVCLGDSHDKSIQFRKIINIPDTVSDTDVIDLFGSTVDLTWLLRKKPRLVFDFSELGIGKIIRE